MKYLSSNRIMIWCIRRWCNVSHSFTSSFQICDRTNIHWVAGENQQHSLNIVTYSTATHRISVGLQLWEREVIQQLKWHNLCLYHVMIQSELKYLIGGKNVATSNGPGVWFLPGDKTQGFVPVTLKTQHKLSCSVPWRVSTLPGVSVPDPTQTGAR